MAGLSFTRAAGAQLFYATTEGKTDPLVAYLLPEGVSTGDQLALADAWQTFAGVFLFLAEAVADEAAFVAAARPYFADASRAGTRFAWVSNPNEADAGIAASLLKMNAVAGGASTTAELAAFTLRNFTLVVGRNAGVRLNEADGSFDLSQPSDDPAGVFLQSQWGGENLFLIGATGLLPLGGADAGALQFQMSAAEDDFAPARLDVCCRIYVDDPDNPGFGLLTAYRYPIFRNGAEALPLRLSWYPLDSWDGAQWRPARSYVGLSGGPVSSYFTTNLGHEVSLAPQSGARLVFTVNPSTAEPNDQDPLYLIPAGDFAMGVEAEVPAARAAAGTDKPAHRVMCGLGGTEYFGLMSGRPDILSFVPGSNAYAPADAAGGLLTGAATTSWARVRSAQAGGVAAYYAQPHQGELYAPGRLAGQADMLGFFETVAVGLDDAAPAFPMLPYAGIAPDASKTPADYQRMEVSRISPLRRALIGTGKDSSKPAAAPITGTTPQGLLATVADDAWLNVTLARDEAGGRLAFANPDNTPLPALFTGTLQANQLFLVISDPDAVQSFFTSTGVEIHQWTFNLDPAQWQARNTILIFKFQSKTLRELAAAPGAWASADRFNADPDDVSRHLSAIIEDAINRCGEPGNCQDPDFDYFVNGVALNPNWNGILALNCYVPLDRLPPQMEGLAAGIDPSLFFAHHLGVDVTPVYVKDGAPTMQPSSMFGLIHYVDDAPPQPDDSGYNFKVATLKVLFKNSAIRNFASTVTVYLNKLFQEPCSLTDDPTGANGITLNGSYQSHDGQDSYVFSQSGTNLFAMTSQVLDAVAIDKAQFTTTLPQPGAGNTLVQTRFTFWGSLRFKALPGFDVFSFGVEPSGGDAAGDGASPGLSFANLGLEMSFDRASPAARTFTFDAGHLAFDLSRSRSRAASLYSHFPLQLTGLTVQTDKTPGDLGFMQVDTPLASSTLGKAWYGLTFTLNLGSVGALAGKVGLVAQVIAAWSPSPRSYNVFVGLSLPGSGGGREISIEGILKLTFGGIAFSVADQSAYLLKLSNIALKFLSKTLPPSGQTAIYLFGDPAATAKNTTLGWYAAYAKNPPPKNGQKSLPPGG